MTAKRRISEGVNMVTYAPFTPERELPLKVMLEGRTVGQIVALEGGYRFIAKGGRHKGEILPTVTAVKRSLEGE